ncbi:hypothetical protein Dimus_022679 [Dionaea muscipula]
MAACKEFYKNLTVTLTKKKEVARSSVRGVKIEMDSMTLALILGVPGNNGICEYIKEVWQESKFIKPIEITRNFANDELINVARRVKLIKMKPFQRFLHFVVMKIVVPRFGKRDTTSFMDLMYMDHILTRRLVNLPRLMMRHMTYVISVENHELPYGDWLTMVFEAFNVPLIDKQGGEPKRYDFFEETFLNMCQLKREQGVWWLEIGGIRRRDDEDEIPVENDQNEEAVEEGQNQEDFEWEAVNEEAEIQGESGSAEKFYVAEDEVQGAANVVEEVPEVPAQVLTQQKETTPAGVDPSGPVGSIPDSVFLPLQAEFERARADRIQADLDRAQAKNSRLLALLQQAKSQHKP